MSTTAVEKGLQFEKAVVDMLNKYGFKAWRTNQSNEADLERYKAGFDGGADIIATFDVIKPICRNVCFYIQCKCHKEPLTKSAISEVYAGMYARIGWIVLLEGILLILLGGYTFARPGSAITGSVILYGVMAVIMGIADILLYVRMERYTGFGPVISLISGTLSGMSGIMLLPIRYIVSFYLLLLGIDCIILAVSRLGSRY